LMTSPHMRNASSHSAQVRPPAQIPYHRDHSIC
jgi:hypothetical protein